MIKLADILCEFLNEDRCKRIADRRYDKPSAYKSGAIVRCRKGNIWKGIKEEVALQEKETLRKWFARQGGTGSSGGWVDCNTCREDPKPGRKNVNHVDVKKVKSVLSILHVVQHLHNVKAQAKVNLGVKRNDEIKRYIT